MIEMTPFRICSILIFVHYEIRYNMIVIAFSFLLETQCLLQNKVSDSKQSVCFKTKCSIYVLRIHRSMYKVWFNLVDCYR